MHVGIDARELLGRRTGVGRYLADLCREWTRLPGDGTVRFTLYGPAEGDHPVVLGPPFDTGPIGPFEYVSVPGRGDSWWEQHHLASALNAAPPDVFFAPAYSAPLRTDVPVVLTIHDVSFCVHPEWFSWREGPRRRWVTRQSARRARRIIAVSEFTRREVLDECGLPPSRIETVWSGVHRWRLPASEARQPLVLFVGSIFNRRHIPELIQAFAQVLTVIPAARLVLVGDNRSHPPQDPMRLARDARIADRVTVRAYVDEPELASLYSQAMVFVFLSEYEGFGLPPFEAMAANIPCVVGDTPVARELYQNAAQRVQVDDVDGIAAAITSLMEDKEVRRRLLAESALRLPLFTWDRASTDTLAILEQVARESVQE